MTEPEPEHETGPETDLPTRLAPDGGFEVLDASDLVEPPAPRPLTPQTRAFGEIEGVPMSIAGVEWLLAFGGARDEMSAIRERLDESAWLNDQYPREDLAVAAEILLRANYYLDVIEAIELVGQTEVKELSEAVEHALFAFVPRDRTYDDWVVSSLLCNGLDPASITTRDLPHVLHQLVMTGRAIPAGDFITAAVEGRKLKGLRAMARGRHGSPASPAGDTTAGE